MTIENQKLTGSFYTQGKVAERMANWAIRHADDSVLEPSFGDGAFIEKALARFMELDNSTPNITAVELQAGVVKRFREVFQGSEIRTLTADFLSLSFGERFDAVIGNPPYVGIKNLPTEQRASARRIIDKHGANCPDNGSLWFPFVLRAIDAIKPNGRLAFVLPFEITYARYAFGLWGILSQNFSNLTICRIYEDFFPDVDVETILLFAEGKGGSTTQVGYEIYGDVDGFLDGRPSIHSRIPLSDITSGEKPFVYAVMTEPQQRLLQQIKQRDIITPIIESCKFKIGYVSADKGFFHPNVDNISKYSIPKENLHPTILNAKQVNGGTGIGIRVGSGECKSSLYLPRKITEGDKLYIQYGETLGVHQRYKCRQRKPWYVTPCVEVPDVVLSVFGETPKMIINDGKYAVSNSLLCGHLKKVSAEQLLCRWYNSLTLLSLELNVHSLGGGSFVIIPGEADRLEIVKNIPQDKVLVIFDKLNETVKKNGVEAAYALGDTLVLQGIFGLSDSDVSLIREAIRTLRSWRNPSKRRVSSSKVIISSPMYAQLALEMLEV
jgi:phospholipid N-methyltransferase